MLIRAPARRPAVPAAVVLAVFGALPLLSETGQTAAPPVPLGSETGQTAAATFDIASQGYYFGGSGNSLSGITGAAVGFRSYLPGIGALSGNFEGYGFNGQLTFGDNFLQLRGFSWMGLRWGVTGGDFRMAPSLVEFPFTNIFLPEIAARGIRVESSSMTRQYAVFFGTETLLEGPRVPFRLTTPQRVLGASVVQKIGERFKIGVRALHLTTDTIPESLTALFPPGENFRSDSSASVQALFKASEHFKIYGEAAVSNGSGTAPVADPSVPIFEPRSQPFSYTFGPVWDSPRLTVRANYIQQTASYLPVAGYFLGDRKGPFGEIRYRPWKAVNAFASTGMYRNNLSNDSRQASFQSSSLSAGGSILLPFKISASSQISWVDFKVTEPGSDAFLPSHNRQMVSTVGRPIRTHNVHVSLRDLTTDAFGANQRQRSLEFEDIFQLHHMSFGGAVRDQRLTAGAEQTNTLFFRGSGQVLFGRFSAYGFMEHGNDLANRTVFATSTFNTTVFGAAVRLAKAWNFQVEASRNQLTTDLNAQNMFLLESQGIGTSNAMTLFNQWTTYFRLRHQIGWGNFPGGDLDKYVAQQIPLVGSIEGMVLARTMAAAVPAKGIPVALDDSRIVTTNDEGMFRFSAVPEGEHKVALATGELPAEFDPGPHRSMPIAMRARHVASAELDVVPLLTLTGRIFGPPNVALDTTLVRLLPGKQYTTPSADGRFAFYNLREGDYEVVLDAKSLPPDSIVTSDTVRKVSLRLGATIEEPQFHFEIHKADKPIKRTFDKP